MIFAKASWLFLLLLLPVLALLEVWARRRDGRRMQALVARALWPRLVRCPAEQWRFARLGLILLGAACIIVAVSRPQWGIVRERVEREGADVVLALDTSASMGTEDVAPSRFFLARQALLSLVSSLGGDRISLLAFEGDAYPLVPLTLDADAVGLFLESVEPGIVPAPGTSLGAGLARGLSMFIDEERRNKVLVIVSDGEDLEGQVEEAVKQAKEKGVVVHTVGVGTEAGQPVPEVNNEGRRTGYKRDEAGQAVVSRLDTTALQAIARGTGGQFFRITPSDSTLASLSTAIEAMDRKMLATEYSYRRKERFQLPLAAGLACFAAALVLPLPRLRRAKWPAGVGAALGLLVVAVPALAQPSPRSEPSATASAAAASPAPPGRASGPGIVSEVLLRPTRRAAEGQRAWEKGDHPAALRAFEEAAATRPDDDAARFNVADGLYKNGRYDEAAALFRDLGQKADSPIAAAARHNLGNSLFQRQDYKGAVAAYRDGLRLKSGDPETRRNLELALRALADQQKQEQQQKQDENDQKKNDEDQKAEGGKHSPKGQNDQKKSEAQPPRHQTKEEREKERFEREAGMPKERAEQLLSAMERNESAEQKKQLAAKRATRKGGKDW